MFQSFALADVVAEYRDTDDFTVRDNPAKVQRDEHTVRRAQFQLGGSLGQCAIEKLIPKLGTVRREHIFETNADNRAHSGEGFNALPSRAIEDHQAVIAIHRPDVVFSAVNQGGEVRLAWR